MHLTAENVIVEILDPVTHMPARCRCVCGG